MAGKDKYKSWLRKDNKNPNKAFCFTCKKSIDVNVMGESAILLGLWEILTKKKVLEISK